MSRRYYRAHSRAPLQRSLTLFTLFLFFTTAALGYRKARIRRLTPTVKGSTGILNIFLPDTLRQGEQSIGFSGTHFHREPGDLDVTLFPLSFTFGLHNRIEVFFSWEAYKRVHADAILVNKLDPGQPTIPSRLDTPEAILAFYNDTPFMDVGFGDGTGDLWAGAKINLFSEVRGAPLGFALQSIARFPVSQQRQHRLRGLTAGTTDWGLDLIFSKNLGNRSTLAGNAGLLFAGDLPDLERQSRFNYGLGIDFPIFHSRASLAAEVLGSAFYGAKTGWANPTSPLEFQGGLRLNVNPWLTISAAYRLNLRTLEEERFGISATGRHGWLVQLTFQRKINEPPSAECRPESATVFEGERVMIRLRALDPDDDQLIVTWKTTGGKLTRQGRSAIFDTTGVKAGKYTIKAELSDGNSASSCWTEVTVLNRKEGGLSVP